MVLGGPWTRGTVADDDGDLAVAANAAFHAKVVEPAGSLVLSEPAERVDRRVRWYHAPRRPAARYRVLDRAPLPDCRDLLARRAAGDGDHAGHTEHARQTALPAGPSRVLLRLTTQSARLYRSMTADECPPSPTAPRGRPGLGGGPGSGPGEE